MKSELIDALVASGEFRVVALADALPPQRYGTPEYKATLNSTWERDYLPDEQLGMPFAVCLKYVDDMGMSLRGEIGGLQAMERPDLAAALAQFDVEQLRDWLAFYCDEGGVK